MNTGIEKPMAAMSPDKSVVLLPCEPHQFRDFISSLLGKPQEVIKFFKGPFEVNREDLENIHHFIAQRLAQQNDATLIQFRAKIFYDNNSQVTLNSFADFRQYAEARPLISTGVRLWWTYLIKFQDRETPEKQEIDIALFGTDPNGDVSEIDIDDIFFTSPPAHIRLCIRHTARTWGADMEALLGGYIKGFLRPPERYKQFLQAHHKAASVIIMLLVLVCGGIGAGISTYDFYQQIQAGAAEAQKVAGADFEGLSKKVEYLIGLMSKGLWTRFTLQLLVLNAVCAALAISVGVFVGSRLSKRNPSFVLLTRGAEEWRAKVVRRLKRSWVEIFVSIAIALLTGVVANYIFAHLSKLTPSLL